MSGVTNKVDLEQIDYTAASANYDALRYHGREADYIERIRRRSFKNLLKPIPRDSTILDVGCGTGRGLWYLAEQGYTRLQGLDYTQAMLDLAEKNLRERFPHIHIPLQQGDAFNLPYPDRAYAHVVSFNFLHMFRFDLQEQLIQEMSRVCARGGRVIVEFDNLHKGLFFNRYFEQKRKKKSTHFNSLWEIRRLFPRQQFEDVQIMGCELPGLHRIFMFAPRMGEIIESIAHFPIIKWLSERVIVSARVRDK